MNIIKNRYLYFLISLLIIIPGIVFMGLNWSKSKVGPLILGIDFRGGSLLEVQFEGPRPKVGDIASLYKEFSTKDEPIAEPVIQPLAEDSFAIRSKAMTDETKGILITEMETRFGSKVTVLNFTSVSPSIGAEVTRAAGFAILLAAAAILLYIWWAFRGVEHPYRYGTAAIFAMLHDVFVVLGTEAILGYFLGWEADALFLTALLTVIGFSVHDTIVVFDRVRENSNILRRVEYETMVNHSIVQTLDRSITTQLTVMLTLFALVLFGGDSTRHFVIILLVGIFSGTYSSIFNAAPILVVWEKREWQTWFRRKATV
ncbi:MAG: protein translocase subunit SecF [Anaerolineaceae bacterium]|nr:MAG: protein translocase subunit SecF [Anaerolineaceae bacterium]